MKRIKCEMCGGTDFIKENGVFVCQNCGTKYTADEARKNMVEIAGTVNVKGTVEVDNTKLINNYLQMAESAMKSNNNKEAETYADKIIEIDPQNSRAWYIKGTAEAWQTTGNNNRYPESITAWINAMHFASQENKEDLENTIFYYAQTIAEEIIKLHCGFFEKNASDESYNSILNNLTIILREMDVLKKEAGIDAKTDAFLDNTSLDINNSVCTAWKDVVLKRYGTEPSDKTKYAFQEFIRGGDCCLGLLRRVEKLSKNETFLAQVCKNFITIDERLRDACSYKYNPNYSPTYSSERFKYIKEYTLTDAARASRLKEIQEYTNKYNFHKLENRESEYKKIKDKLTTGTISIQKEFAKKKYWQEHPEEFKDLNEKKIKANNELELLNQKIKANEIPEAAKRQDVLNEIDSLKNEEAKLGFFKGKEKKAINSQIQEKQIQVRELTGKIDKMVSDLKVSIEDIDSEITKDRGSEKLCRTVFIHPNKEGQLLSPNQLTEFLQSSLYEPYKISNAEDLVDSLQNKLGKFDNKGVGIYQINIDKKNNDSNAKSPYQQTEVDIMGLGQNNSKDDPCRIIYLDLKDKMRDQDAVYDFVQIASQLIVNVSDNVNISEFQDFILKNFYQLTFDNKLALDNVNITCLQFSLAFLPKSSNNIES